MAVNDLVDEREERQKKAFEQWKVSDVLTEKSKAERLKALAERRAHMPTERIDDSLLYAGSAMHFYCISCGHAAGTLPESYITPLEICRECEALKKLGWLE